jgi:hypothetical protein
MPAEAVGHPRGMLLLMFGVVDVDNRPHRPRPLTWSP